MKNEILRVENLYITSHNNKILSGIHLNMFKGESIALMGLSGSGASLFVDALCGKAQGARGRIIINEKKVNLENETDSRFYGIYRMSNEQTLINGLDIAENIFIMRRNSIKSVFINRKILNIQARLLLKRIGVDISPTTMVGKLTFAEKQLVELAKAVGSGAKIIIFDEIFAYYHSDEIDRLKAIVDVLKKEGVSFIFRSHYIEECRLLSEKIIIFKNGKISKKIETSKFDDSMVGDYVVGHTIKKKKHTNSLTLGDTALEVKRVSCDSGKTRGFSVKHGEVLALLDIYSKDKEKLIQMLVGVRDGFEIHLNGKRLKKIDLKNFHKSKVVLIPNPAQKDGLFQSMDIGENLLFPSLKKAYGIAGFIDKNIPNILKKQFLQKNNSISENIEELDLNQRIALSLERWLLFRPEVIIMMDPYLQADIVVSRIITEYIDKFAKSGIAVIILSSRPDKLKEGCNRIINIEGFLNDFVHNSKQSLAKRISKRTANSNKLAQTGGKYIVAFFIIFGYLIMERKLLNFDSIMILLRQFAIIGFAVLGAYITTLCDGANLSVGPQAAFASILVVILVGAWGLPIWLAVLITFIVAAILGASYAIFTIKTGVPIVLLSFGMLHVLNGFNSILQNWHSSKIDSIYFLIKEEVFHVPIVVYMFIFLVAIVGLLLKHTYLGRSIFVVGSNMSEARRSGLQVDLVKILAYIFSFLIINITGLLFLARTSTGSFEFGNNYFFDIIAALCIGRISLWGGKGSLFGVILGALSIVLLESYFIITNVQGISQEMIKGFIIIVMILKEYYINDKYSQDINEGISL